MRYGGSRSRANCWGAWSTWFQPLSRFKLGKSNPLLLLRCFLPSMLRFWSRFVSPGAHSLFSDTGRLSFFCVCVFFFLSPFFFLLGLLFEQPNGTRHAAHDASIDRSVQASNNWGGRGQARWPERSMRERTGGRGYAGRGGLRAGAKRVGGEKTCTVETVLEAQSGTCSELPQSQAGARGWSVGLWMPVPTTRARKERAE